MFQQFETLQGPGLQPAATEALKLLHRLAADPGIVAIMRAHRWTVGRLSEMPPEVTHTALAPHELKGCTCCVPILPFITCCNTCGGHVTIGWTSGG